MAENEIDEGQNMTAGVTVESDARAVVDAQGAAMNRLAGTTPANLEPEGRSVEVDHEFEYRRRKAGDLRGAMEHREFTATEMESRTLDDGTIRMSGYASLTEQPYEVGPFTETIRRGAFRRTLSESPDTVLLLNHEGAPLARTKNGSLVLSEDARGLQWTADLDPEDPDSRALARRVESGLLDQCSFAFLCTDDEWSDDYKQRTVKSLSINRGDVSVVTHGANPATTVGLRALATDLELRAGKSLSASNLAEVEAIFEAAGRLVAQAKGASEEKTEDEDEGSLVEAGKEALAETLVEAPEPVARFVRPDHTTRALEELAILRRAG